MDKGIVIVKIGGHKEEYELEIPLEVTVKEICLTLNKALKLEEKGIFINSYHIRTENPTCFLKGKDMLKKCGISDGSTIILFQEKREESQINFFIDFPSEKENYDRVINISKVPTVTIGRSKENNIAIDDSRVDDKHCVIKKEKDNQYYIHDFNSRYGVHINGKKVYTKAQIQDNDFIIICGYKILFKENTLALSSLYNNVEILDLRFKNIAAEESPLEYPAFIRSPRYYYNLPKGKIELPTPPENEKRPMFGLLATMIPLLGMMFLSLKTNTGSNGLYYVGMVVVTAISTTILFILNLMKYYKQLRKRKKMYLTHLREQEGKIQALIEEQQRVLSINSPSLSENIETMTKFKRRLWERSYGDEDFLNVKLGYGVIPISFEIEVPKEDWTKADDQLILLPYKMKEKYSKIGNAPIGINLFKNNAIGIVGDRDGVKKIIWNSIIDLATYHYYEDVKFVVVYNEEEQQHWQWLKWFPHVWGYKKGIRFMGNNKESAHVVLNCIHDIIKEREELLSENNNSDDVPKLPHFVILITDPNLIRNEPVAKYLESTKQYGITTIFAYDHVELLPRNCVSVVEIDADLNGRIVTVKESEKIEEISFTAEKQEVYESFTKKMAPVFVKTTFSQNSLPSCITLFDLYGVSSSSQIPILNNWNKNKVYETMEAPLGVNLAGEVVYLNLHEKFHGPHGLVAGTTGSGKSEIIQSYIISLAINFHPHDIAFILIDYKGGGMANQFRNLPHLVGTITNLDGNQINRSLIAIKSELKKRQRIFAEYNVNHIDQYIKLYKEGNAKEPMPHLIMIADEFAELKTDQPDFMKELVSTARIGRSLGVHLILATQKPAGVVDDQIWSNSKFKLCLKVQDAGDSREILKTDLAATIVEPGRAFFQVGNNEIFELFQSAWSGAKKYEDDDVSKTDIEISEVSIEGRRNIIYSSKDENKNKPSTTELDETIKQIDGLCKKMNINRLQGPWLPILEDVIYLDQLLEGRQTGFNGEQWIKAEECISPVVGLFDDPENQLQENYRVQLAEEGHMILIGAPGYGKTTFLQTLMTSLLLEHTPEEVNIYILDFGTRTLKIFEQAPHVGGVILSDEEEKLTNFIRFIYKEIDKRKKMFSEQGVASLSAYKQATGRIIPQVVIILDGFAAFKELYENQEDDITTISREGATLGISLVITSANYSGLRYKMTSNFKINIALNCIDKSEYSSIFGSIKIAPADVKGRAIAKCNGINELQIALPVRGETEVERATNLKELIQKMKEAWIGKNAVPIPEMPEVLYFDDITNDLEQSQYSYSYPIACGIGNTELEYVYTSLEENPIMSIVGKSKSGKSNFLRTIAKLFEFREDNTEVYLIDSTGYGLRSIRNLKNMVFYGTEQEEVLSALNRIKVELEKRENYFRTRMLNEDVAESDHDYMDTLSNIVILVDDVELLVKYVENDIEMSEFVAHIIDQSRSLKVSMIAAGTEDKFKEYVYSLDFVKKLKDEQCGLIFDSLDSQRFYDVQLKYGQIEKKFEKGDGYFVVKNFFVRVKTPLCDER